MENLLSLKRVHSNIFFKVSCLILVVIILYSDVAAAEVYKWTDEDGKVHFGDKPPAEAESESINVRPTNTSSSPETEDNGLTSPSERLRKQHRARMEAAREARKKALQNRTITLPDGSTVPVPTNEEESAQLEELVRQKTIDRLNKQRKPGEPEINAETTAKLKALPCRVLTQNDCSGRDLGAADYSSLKLKGMNFSYSQLADANFSSTTITSGARFIGTNLKGANFDGSTLHNVDFSNADLTGATLTNISCNNCIFDNAKLNNAVISGESIIKVSFVKADLQDARFQSPMSKWREWDFREVKNLDYKRFNEFVSMPENRHKLYKLVYSFRGCDMATKPIDCRNLDLSGHHFLPVNLNDANFSGANLQGADLSALLGKSRINFNDANLENAFLPKISGDVVYFRNANLRRAKFVNGRIRGDFTGANLSEINFDKNYLIDSILTDAKLAGANLRNATVLPSQLQGADITGCEFCQQIIDDSTIDVSILKEYLLSNEGIQLPSDIDPSDATAVLEYRKSQAHALKQLHLLASGKALLNDKDLIDLLKIMLSPDSYRHYSIAFGVIRKNKSQANICRDEELQGQLLPLLHFDNKELDETGKSQRPQINSAIVREYTADCLAYSVRQSPTVQQAFVSAFKREGDIKAKRKLMQGLVEVIPEAQSLLLKSLKEGDIFSSSAAAQQLSTWHQPPIELLPWLVEKFNGNRNVPEGYARLLASYGASARDHLPALEGYLSQRKTNKWKDDGLSAVVEALQLRTNVQPTKRTPQDYSRQSVLDSFLLPDEMLVETGMELTTSPTHFASAGDVNQEASYSDKLKRKFDNWTRQASNYFKEPAPLPNPIYTQDTDLIETAASHYNLNNNIIEKIKLSAGVEYRLNHSYFHSENNKIGIDVFSFENELSAERSAAAFTLHRGARSIVSRSGRIIYVLWGDAMTDAMLPSLYQNMRRR